MDKTGNAPNRLEKSPTSFDVAKLAGVSQSSVSRVFNKNWGSAVRDDIREKVLQAAKQLNYRPNALARSLNVNRSSIIGVVVSQQYNDFYHHLLNKITNILQRMDMRIMVINIAPGNDLGLVISRLREYQVDGIIITGAALTNKIHGDVIDSACPTVLLNIFSEEIPCSSVYCDNYTGSFKMAQHLYKGGCRSFVYVSAAGSPYMNHEKRQEGFIAGLKASGPYTCQVATGDYSYESGMQAARSFLSGEEKPHAFFCANELMAFGVMDVARYEMGLRIPQDLSVAGYDDTFASSLAAYNLTAVQQPMDKMAEDTVAVMTQLIERGGQKPLVVCEPMSLVVRSSSC